MSFLLDMAENGDGESSQNGLGFGGGWVEQIGEVENEQVFYILFHKDVRRKRKAKREPKIEPSKNGKVQKKRNKAIRNGGAVLEEC